MKLCITQPYQTGKLGFSFAKIGQLSRLRLEFQKRTLHNFAKALLSQDS